MSLPPPNAAPAASRTIAGDFNAAQSPLDHAGDLCVQGSVAGGANAKASGAIRVAGGVRSAQLIAGGAIHIAGAVAGPDTLCQAGTELHCTSATAARLVVGGDLTVADKILSCQLEIGGAARCDQATFSGGCIRVTGGLICQTLGDSAGKEPTIVELGIDERLRTLGAQHADALDQQTRAIDAMRKELRPLQERFKSLSASQRERVTELLFTLEEDEPKLIARLNDLRRQVIAWTPRARSELIVHRTLHAGVTIRFSNTEFTINARLDGPLKLAKPKLTDGEVVITDLSGAEKARIPFKPYADPTVTTLCRVLAWQKPAEFNKAA